MTDPDQPQREPSEPSAEPAQGPMSLEQLSGALAGLFGLGDEAEEASERGEADEQGLADDALGLPEESEDAAGISPKSILEAMLFVGRPDNQPLSSTQAAALMRGVEPAEVDELVEELNADYQAHDRPYEIISAGAGYRMALREPFHAVRDRLYGRTRQAKLSQAAVEVLAIVAYNQPVTAEALSKLRGTPSGAILSQLVRRQLLRLEREAQRPRTPRYFTTDRFLQLFGLKGLEDLPQSQELDQQ